MAAAMPEVEAWRSDAFRETMIHKINETILKCGNPTGKSAAELEKREFLESNNIFEYMQSIAGVILKIMNEKSQQKMSEIGGASGTTMQGQQNQSSARQGFESEESVLEKLYQNLSIGRDGN